ncbi:MAG: tetratricopeptide repeat protein [Candidatus Krumholzibacteriota bacterium]|nr:tetratricopeptide repeat protein [Candidatus Krumholzibacteriota bacterium]
MIDIFFSKLLGVQWLEVLRLFIDVTLKGTIICAGAWAATLLLRRSSAFVKNMVWVSVLFGLVILPVLSVMTPVWRLPLLPEPGNWSLRHATGEYGYKEIDSAKGSPVNLVVGSKEGGTTGSENPVTNFPWYVWAFAIWVAGVLLYLCWFIVSRVGLRYLVLNSQSAPEDWKNVLEDVAGDLDLKRKVRLLESGKIKAAITTGVFKPVVIVPAESENWSETRRRLVLSHELAHVKRWDALIEVFSLIATVLYWFNPVVLFSVRQLRIERERDCDDAVLCAGAKPSDYAQLLMDIAADLSCSVGPVWQLSTISQGSNLKERIMNILNSKIDRKRGSRRIAIITSLLVLMIVLPLATSGLWNSQAVAQSEKDKKAKTEKLTKEEQLKMKQQQLEAEKNMTDAEKQQLKLEKKKQVQEKLMMKWTEISENENSAAGIVGKAIKKDGIDQGTKVFYKLKKNQAEGTYFKEEEFNTLGYVFLSHGKTEEAIRVFELNAKEYPDSWNAYDSLGEGYLTAGKTDEAQKCYEKSLKLNPENKNGQMILQKIKMKKEGKEEEKKEEKKVEKKKQQS